MSISPAFNETEEVYAASTSLQVLLFAAIGTTKYFAADLPITMTILPLGSISTRPSMPAAITAWIARVLHEKSRPSRTAKLVQWYSCGLKTRLALLRIGRTARTRKNVVLGKSRIVPALQGWFGEVPASRATTAGRGAYRGGRRN